MSTYYLVWDDSDPISGARRYVRAPHLTDVDAANQGLADQTEGKRVIGAFDSDPLDVVGVVTSIKPGLSPVWVPADGGIGGGAGTTPWLGWTVPSVPGGATVVTSGSQLVSILQGGGVAGTVYDATALTTSLTDTFGVFANGAYPDGSPITVFMGPGVKFMGATTATCPAVDMPGAQNMTLYGGDIQNPTKGSGIDLRSSTTRPAKNIKWWDFKVHNVAQGGLFVAQNNGYNIEGCDLRGEIYDWSRACLPGGDLSLDPHTMKGSGLQGAYLGPLNPGHIHSCTFVLYVHDCAFANGVSIGDYIQNTEIQVKAENLTGDPAYFNSVYGGGDGTAGNAIAMFGSGKDTVTVSFLTADNCRTGVFDAAEGAAVTTTQFTYGRVANQWRDINGTLWEAYASNDPYLSYSDCL